MTGEVWIICEQKDNNLLDITFELLAWGRKLTDQCKTMLSAVIFSNGMSKISLNRLIQMGADKVYVVQDTAFDNFLVEPQAHVMQYLVNINHPEIILAGATTTGRTLMPYISMILHTGLTADCTDLVIEDVSNNLLQIRPAIGGNIMAMIRTPDTRPQMSTVRPKSICALKPDPTRKGEIISVAVPANLLKSRVRFEKHIIEDHDHAGLDEANIVVSSGLGLQNPNAKLLMDAMAKSLGAKIGSSRPPVDQGYQPYSRQVGLTGRTISPELYIACGISGAVQHLAGIHTAKNIIAINRDAEAPIFQVADFGIVGDAEDILPVLLKHIKEDL